MGKNDYNNNIKKVFNLLSVKGKYQIIGSAKLADIHYKSDYDLQEFIDETNRDYPSVLLDLFQKKFEKAEMDSSIFITDFKCGETKTGEPIRWDKKSIIAGKQKVDGGKMVSFKDCLLMKTIMKMDIIALIDGGFNSFSENYYIRIGDQTNYVENKTTKTNLMSSIRGDIKNYFQSGDTFKSLKRLFSFFKLEGNHEKEMKKLIVFFNGQVGFLNKSTFY